MGISEERFVAEIAQVQSRLLTYVYSIVGDRTRANDIVQETNLVLWRRRADYDAARPFSAWAIGVARMQTLASIRDRSRDKLLLSADLADQIADDAAARVDRWTAYRESLRACLNSLSEEHRDLIRRRYTMGQSLESISDATGRTTAGVKTTLHRIRRQLHDCIRRRLEIAS